MGRFSDQKELQREFQKGRPERETAAAGSKSGPFRRRADLKVSEAELERDIRSYSGIPLKEKIKKKTALVAKYKSLVDQAFRSGLAQENEATISAYTVWLYDTGDIAQFIELADRAAGLGLRQTLIPNKDYRLLKLYWVMDWTARQRDAGLSYEPYFSHVFDSVEDWNLPRKIREGYHYFKFYSLVASGELEQALKFGERAIEMGAEIKTNHRILRDIVASKTKKKWDRATWKFVKRN